MTEDRLPEVIKVPSQTAWGDSMRDHPRDERPVPEEPPQAATEPDPEPDLDGFDPVAAAREHWDAPFRYAIPDQFIRGNSLLAKATRGGVEGEEALQDMVLKWRRAGWHHRSGVDGIRHWYRHD